MAIDPSFYRFVTDWLEKADQIKLNSLATYFDKFFTLYVAYNRLYAEITFTLSRNGQINISDKTSFPDKKAATAYILQFMGAGNFISEITKDENSLKALEEIIRLIQEEHFYIKLDMITGKRHPECDIELLKDLENDNKGIKGRAILQTFYSIRCNMFHGHKGFEKVQIGLLQPTMILLRKTINIALDKLQKTDYR
jgi:CRISPR/Cas system CMR-associated protein Cmr5 small subunit